MGFAKKIVNNPRIRARLIEQAKAAKTAPPVRVSKSGLRISPDRLQQALIRLGIPEAKAAAMTNQLMQKAQANKQIASMVQDFSGLLGRLTRIF